MNVYLISDTHFNHHNIKTYCQRPEDFTERILSNLRQTLKQEDLLIHLGDVYIGKRPEWLGDWPGRKVLIRGNHDEHGSSWWMNHGFDMVCDGMLFRKWWLTHKPANSLPEGAVGNIHGHLHNVWHGFGDWSLRHVVRDEVLLSEEPTKRLKFPWQRLFAVEYTNYAPVEFDKFIAKPDKYQARGPK